MNNIITSVAKFFHDSRSHVRSTEIAKKMAKGKKSLPKSTFKKTTFKAKPKKSLLIQPTKALELKNFDAPVSALALTSNVFTAGQPANLIVTGDTALDRTGRKVLMKSFYLRYSFASSAAANATQVRILVVYDKQTNGTLPAITDVVTVNDALALNNLNNSQRFVTICDHISPMTPFVTANSNGVIFKKLNLEAMYSASTGAITDIATGSIVVFIAPLGLVNTSTISYKARIRFADP